MNRLSELRGGTEGGKVAPSHVALSVEDPDNAFMSDFFEAVERVKENINLIKVSTKRIGEIDQQVSFATTSEKEAELSKELAPEINKTNRRAKETKDTLKKLKDETDKATQDKSAKDSELRIRENLVNTLTRKFVDVMKEYQAAQQQFKANIKKKVKRQVQIVKPDATTEEIDAVLKSGGGAGEVMKSAILKGDAADSIRNAFLNVADKYQDVLTLEASVAELHQMFLDFALLTEQQGELLDQIEFQVKAASDYIEQGNVDIVEAIDLQKSIRRKQCCIIITVLVIIGAIVGIAIGVYKQQNP